MKTEFMNQESIIALLKSQGLEPTTKQDTSRLMISKKVIRYEMGDTMIVGMGSGKEKDDQVHLVVDAVHLCLQAKSKKKTLRLIFGKRKDENQWKEVKNAVALMIESINIDDFKIETEVDGEKVDFKSESFNEDVRIERWMQYLSQARIIPDCAKELEQAINDPLFRWYRSVTGINWSGRVGGLEVCIMDLTGQKSQLNVGKQRENDDGQVRKIFLKILKKENLKPGSFSLDQFEKIALTIRELAESRRNGELNKFQREHLIESYVLSEKVKIISKEGELKPVCKDNPFQFPTLWAPSAKPRFVDALMSLGNIPYVVELKEPSGSSPGQGYRHAITQAVLYREFIRRTHKIHPWFTNNGLDPIKCRAIVAFPELVPKDNKKKQMLLTQHKQVAEAFDVNIVEINATGLCRHL